MKELQSAKSGKYKVLIKGTFYTKIEEAMKLNNQAWYIKPASYAKQLADEMDSICISCSNDARNVFNLANDSGVNNIIVLGLMSDLDNDIEEVVHNIASTFDCNFMVGNCDGADLISFSTEEAINAFSKWCEQNVYEEK